MPAGPLLASPSVGHMLVPKAIARFRHPHPEVRVEFEILTLAELIARIASHRADLTSMAVEDPTVEAPQIAEGRLRVTFPEGHPLGAKRVLKQADFVPYPIIGYGSQTPYGVVVNCTLSAAPKPVRFNAQVRFTPNACCLV